MTGTETNNAGSPHSTAPKTSEEIARTLRLRPERPPVTRLSRKVLASGTALALLLVSGGRALGACRTIVHAGPAPEELYSTDHHNVADGLAGLPRDYAGIPRDVPRLGPPLPGDLGRPIVAAQAQSGPLAVDAEQQRMNQESEAARTSKVFASTNVRPSAATTPAETTSNAVSSSDEAYRPERAGSQACLRQRLDRSPDDEPRSRNEAGVSLRRAGRVRHSGRSHHGPPLRSTGANHRAGDRERL